MSRPRFLIDHDFDEDIIDGALRLEPRIEVVRCRDVGLSQSADPVMLAFAAENDLIVLSHDVNTLAAEAYARIAAGQPMPGLFLVRQLTPIGAAIRGLLTVWSASESEEWVDRVEFLSR